MTANPPEPPQSGALPEDSQKEVTPEAPHFAHEADEMPSDPYSTPGVGNAAPEAPIPAAAQAQQQPTEQTQPAPASTMTAEESREQLQKLLLTLKDVIGNPVPSLLGGLSAYAVGLIVATISLVLAFIGMLVLPGGSDYTPGNLIDRTTDLGIEKPGIVQTVLFYAGLPAQTVAAAFFSPYGVKAHITGNASQFGGEFDANFAAGIFEPSGLVLIAVLVAAVYAGRYLERRFPSMGQPMLWIQSFFAGLVVAIVSTILVLITALRFSIDEGGTAVKAVVGAGGPAAFFWILVFITLMLALGRMSVRTRPTWWPRVHEVIDAFKLAGLHIGLMALAGFLLLCAVCIVGGLSQGQRFIDIMRFLLALVFFLPLTGVNLLATLAGFGFLSGVGVHAEGSAFFTSIPTISKVFSIFDFEIVDWWVTVIALLVTLALVCVMSIVWAQSRPGSQGDVVATVASWAALPVAYFVTGVVMVILTAISISSSMTGSAEATQMISAGVVDVQYVSGLAAWTPFLTLLFGVVIEVLARFAAPFVAPFIPVNIGAFVHKRSATVPVAASQSPDGVAPHANADSAAAGSDGEGVAVAPQAGAAAVASAVVSEGSQPTTSHAQVAPMSPKTKKRLVIGAVITGAVVLLIAACAITVGILSSTVFSPKNEVESYLTAVQEGRFGDAAEIAPPNVPNGNRIFLTNDVGKGTENRIESYEISDVETNDDGAVVTASVTVDGVKSDLTYKVERSGSTLLVFPKWEMESPEYQMLSIAPDGSGKYIVNGAKVDASKAEMLAGSDASDYGDDLLTFPVMPGKYKIKYDIDPTYVEATEGDVTVPAQGEISYGTPYAMQLNEEGKKLVTKQAQDQLNACIKGKTEPRLTGELCSDFSAFVFSQAPGTKGSWKIGSYPTLEISEGGDGEWYVSTETMGKATYSYMREDFSDKPVPETYDVILSVRGELTIDANGKPSVTWSKY